MLTLTFYMMVISYNSYLSQRIIDSIPQALKITRLKTVDFYDFSVWLRTSSNPADINWFVIHTGIIITLAYHNSWHFIDMQFQGFISTNWL